jgi:hypothetical protein
LPLGLKYSLVDSVIAPGDPANALAKAAFLAAQPKPDLEEVRFFLDEAEASGAETEAVRLVLQELVDPAAVAVSNVPPMTPSAAPAMNELEDLTRLVQTARTALAERNLDGADQALTKAESLAKLPEHRAKIARLKKLAYFTREFWNAVGKGLSGLKAGQEITIGGVTIIIVEADADRLVFRAPNEVRNRRYSRAEIPGGVAMAVANLWLNESDPTSRVVKGAAYAVETKGAPAQVADRAASARRLWQEAAQMGADTSDLMMTLDESYDFTH